MFDHDQYRLNTSTSPILFRDPVYLENGPSKDILREWPLFLHLPSYPPRLKLFGVIVLQL
jgi:hypothetical protein